MKEEEDGSKSWVYWTDPYKERVFREVAAREELQKIGTGIRKQAAEKDLNPQFLCLVELRSDREDSSEDEDDSEDETDAEEDWDAGDVGRGDERLRGHGGLEASGSCFEDSGREAPRQKNPKKAEAKKV